MHTTDTIPATFEAVSEFIQQLEQRWAAMPLAERIGLTLPLQELCVNIVEHAYAGQDGQIRIEFAQAAQQMTITLTDTARKPFTLPTSISAPNPDDLPEGGMGLFIIYQSFDHVSYERLPDGNRWQLTKRLSS